MIFPISVLGLNMTPRHVLLEEGHCGRSAYVQNVMCSQGGGGGNAVLNLKYFWPNLWPNISVCEPLETEDANRHRFGLVPLFPLHFGSSIPTCVKFINACCLAALRRDPGEDMDMGVARI